MALTDVAVRQAKAADKDYTLPDFDGLTLAVSATGTKSWHFRYTWLGRQKRMDHPAGGGEAVAIEDAEGECSAGGHSCTVSHTTSRLMSK